MDLSERHARRLLAAYRELGAEALAHGNRGRRPHNAVPEAVAATVVRLAASALPGRQPHPPHRAAGGARGLVLSRSTVRRILTRAGMASPRRRRPPQHRVRRERMPRAGMLLQLDGSHHAWLEQRGPRFALLLAVDDATGAVVHALFRPAEDARGYFLLMEQVLRRSGVPLALYSDPPRRLPGLRPAARGRRGVHPVRAGDGGAGGPPDLRPLTAGQGPGGAHGGDLPGPPRDRTAPRLGHHHRRGAGRARALPAALQRALRGRRPPARTGLAAARLRRSTWAPSSPSGTPAASRATTPSSTTDARCSCCPQRSGPATPARAWTCWSAQAASLRCATRARPSPPGSPRPAQACCASAAPSWRATRRSSASLWVSAPGWPARPAGASCRGERDGRQRRLAAGPGQAAAPAHPAAAGALEGHPPGTTAGALDARHRPRAGHLAQHRQRLHPRLRPTRTPGCGIIYRAATSARGHFR